MSEIEERLREREREREREITKAIKQKGEITVKERRAMICHEVVIAEMACHFCHLKTDYCFHLFFNAMTSHSQSKTSPFIAQVS